MADQTNNNTPVLPELKTYSVQNGEYLYLYAGHYKMGANGRRLFVKGPKSAARLKPLDNSNNKFIVLWQDWFLVEHPELLSYNTYYEPVSTSLYSMAPQPCFSFSAKSGSSHTNSMNRQQYYEAGATWVFDQLLNKTPLLVALNHKYLKNHLTPELLSLSYFVALTEHTNFKDYGLFAGRTRLSTQEPFSSDDISTFLQTKCGLDQMDLWAEIYSLFERDYGKSSEFWIIDTAYPNHMLERLSSGEDVPYIESSKDLTSLINRFKLKNLFKSGNSLHNYQRLLQREPTRILTVANIKNGQAYTFTPYNLEQLSSADLVGFVQDCSMWQNTPVIEDKKPSIEDESLVKGEYEVLTEEQLKPKMRAITNPFQTTLTIQPLHPSNLNISRSTVVINNNIDAKERGSKTIVRPSSGILPPLTLGSSLIKDKESGEKEATDLSILESSLHSETKESSAQLNLTNFNGDIKSLGDTKLEQLANSALKSDGTEPSIASSLSSSDQQGTTVSTKDEYLDKLQGEDHLENEYRIISRLKPVKIASNELVTNLDVTQLQQIKKIEQQMLEEELAREKAIKEAQELEQKAREDLESACGLDARRNKKSSLGVFVTDRCEHITEQFEYYQRQHLPFLLQVLPDNDLFQLCLDKVVDCLVQPDNYDPVLNRSFISIDLMDKPEEYSEILNYLKQEDLHGNTDGTANSHGETSHKTSRSSAIGSLFSGDSYGVSSSSKKKERAKSDSTRSKRTKQVKDLLQIQELHETSPLSLHVCFDFRALIKLANHLDSLSTFDKSETIVDQIEFDMAINSRNNDLKLKKDIVERASGRMGQKPRYNLSDSQLDIALELDGLLQERNHIFAPEIAKMQRELKASEALEKEDAEFIAQPPEIEEWTTENELYLESLIRKLLQTKLPRSVLQLSITNSMHRIDDALFACHMLQTQSQIYERLGEDVLRQERTADNALLSLMPNNSLEREIVGKQFLWFLALNMKFMMNFRMERSNRKSDNALELKRGIYTADEMLEHLRMITATRKEGGLEYPRTVNIKKMFMLLSYLGIQEPSTEAFTTYNNNSTVPLIQDNLNYQGQIKAQPFAFDARQLFYDFEIMDELL